MLPKTPSATRGSSMPIRSMDVCELIFTAALLGDLFISWNRWILLLPAVALLARVQLISRTRGRRTRVVVLIGATLALAIAAGVEHATVGLCLLITSFNAIELFQARPACASDALLSAPAASLLKIWCTMAAVSGVVLVISYWLGQIPPANLLPWADRLEPVDKLLETAEKVSEALLLSLVVFYFVAASHWRGAHGAYTKTWRGILFSRRILDNASLLLACVAAFSFTAGRSSDGPTEKLTEARAKVLSEKYQDVIWTVELEIRKHALLQIANEALDSSPPSVRAALAEENALLTRPTPPFYFKENRSRLTADDLRAAKEAQTERSEAFRRAALGLLEAEKKKDATKRELISLPPGVSQRQLESAIAQVRDFDHSERPPYWLNDTAWEGIEETVKLGVSEDRVSVLKLIGEQMPLAGKLIEVAFDAVDESVLTKIRPFAVEIVDRRLKGVPADLASAVKYAADIIRQQVVAHNPSWRDWTVLEAASHSKIEAADHAQRAFEVFRRDLLAAIASEKRKPAKAFTFFAKLAATDDADELRMLFARAGNDPCPAATPR
jgi:hypothetical protein